MLLSYFLLFNRLDMILIKGPFCMLITFDSVPKLSGMIFWLKLFVCFM